MQEASETLSNANEKLDDAGELIVLVKKLVALTEGAVMVATDLIQDIDDGVTFTVLIGDKKVPISLFINPSEEEEEQS
jgi:hypothetical protein